MDGLGEDTCMALAGRRVGVAGGLLFMVDECNSVVAVAQCKLEAYVVVLASYRSVNVSLPGHGM